MTVPKVSWLSNDMCHVVARMLPENESFSEAVPLATESNVRLRICHSKVEYRVGWNGVLEYRYSKWERIRCTNVYDLAGSTCI